MPTIDVKDAAGDTQTIAKVPDTGQAAMADSLPVVIASDQSAVPVSGTFWQATQPISAASLPLPSGAATETSLASVLSALGTPFQAGGSIGNATFGATQSGSWTVTANAGSGTFAISAASLPLPTGAATESTLDARTGSLTETAPASDTASSGINGRLQRIAQRITSLIALLPSSLGIKTAANSLSIAPASDAVFQIASATAAPTSISGTITTGATAQNAASSNSSRKGFMLQNNSTGDLWFSTLATAVQSQPSIKLPPGAYYESPLGAGGTGAISIIGATTGQAWSGREW